LSEGATQQRLSSKQREKIRCQSRAEYGLSALRSLENGDVLDVSRDIRKGFRLSPQILEGEP
jgi:hypothetical protein